MITRKNRKQATQKRHYRMRRRLNGTAEMPRLVVYRSVKHIYAQLIDDVAAVTLASASSNDAVLGKELAHGGNIEAAKAVGALVAKNALAKNITSVVFDRGGNLYHGRVKALADAAREAGLVF